MKKNYTIVILLFLCCDLYAGEQQRDSLFVADSLMEAYQYAKAREVLYSIQRFRPDNADVLYKLAYCHNQMGNYFDGKIYLENAYKIDSSGVNIILQLAQTYNKLGQDDKAVQAYKRLIELDSTNGYYYRITALELSNNRKYGESIYYLKKAIHYNDLDMESYNLLAKLYFNSGLFNHAKDIANTGLSKNPRNADLIFINMRIAFTLRNYEEVTELGEMGASVSHDSSRWNLYTGYAYYYRNNYTACIQWLLTSVRDGSIGEQGYTYLANSYLNTGDNDNAMSCLDKAIKMGMDNNLESNLQNKAILLNDQGKGRESLQLFEKAYHIYNNPKILYRQATIHYNLKEYAKARTKLNQYLRSGDKDFVSEARQLLTRVDAITKNKKK